MEHPSSTAGWRVVRKRLADGSVREYRYPRQGAPKPPAPEPETLLHLTMAWRASPEWATYAPRTRQTYLTHIKEIEQAPRVMLRDLRRRHCLAWRDQVALRRGPGAAWMFLVVLSAAFAWAVRREWLESSPLHALAAPEHVPWPTWTMEDYALAQRKLPERLRRAVLLAFHTGQRAGDLVAMKWEDIRGDVVFVRQGKTGAELLLPIGRKLAGELVRWRADATTPLMLERAPGAAWSRDTLSSAIVFAARALGIRKSLHGLRKLCATALAEAGASAHEIASITGHRSLAMVAHYTRAADQLRLARAAMDRLDRHPSQPVDETVVQRLSIAKKKPTISGS